MEMAMMVKAREATVSLATKIALIYLVQMCDSASR